MAVTFTLTGTALYTPDDPAAALYARFLRWNAQGAPGTLSLEDVWPAAGTPASVGYFAFADGAFPDGFEAAFRGLLPPGPPTATGFAWVSVAGTPALKALALVEEAGGARRLSAGVAFPLPPGTPSLGLAQGAPVLGAAAGDGTLDGFTVAFPPLPGAEPPAGIGISLPMAGAAAGALRFQGLMTAGASGAATVKQLWNVQVDPLRPFDPTRTYHAYTARAYLLTGADGAFHIAPLA